MPNAETSECLYVCDRCAAVIRQAIFVCCSKWRDRDLYLCMECFKEFHCVDEPEGNGQLGHMKVTFRKQTLERLLSEMERVCEERRVRSARRRYDAILQCEERFRKLLNDAQHVVLITNVFNLLSTTSSSRGSSSCLAKELSLALTTAYLNARAVVDITLLIFSSLAARLLPLNVEDDLHYSTLDSILISTLTTGIINAGGESSTKYNFDDDNDDTGSVLEADEEDGYGVSRFQSLHRVSAPKLKRYACASHNDRSEISHNCWPTVVAFGGDRGTSKKTSVERGHRDSGNTSSNSSTHSSTKVRWKSSSSNMISSLSQPSTSGINSRNEQPAFHSSTSKDLLKKERMREHKQSVLDKKKREKLLQEQEEQRRLARERESQRASSLARSSGTKYIQLSELPSSSKATKIKSAKSSSSIPQLFAPEFLVSEKNGAKVVTKLDPKQVAMFLQRSTSVGAVRNMKDEQAKVFIKRELSSKMLHDDRKSRDKEKRTTTNSHHSLDNKLRKKNDERKKRRALSPSAVKRKTSLTSVSPPPVSRSSKSVTKDRPKKNEESTGANHVKASRSDTNEKVQSIEKKDSHAKAAPSAVHPKLVPQLAPRKPTVSAASTKTAIGESKKDQQVSSKSEIGQTQPRKELDVITTHKDRSHSSDKSAILPIKPSSAPWKGMRGVSSTEKLMATERKTETTGKSASSKSERNALKREKSSLRKESEKQAKDRSGERSVTKNVANTEQKQSSAKVSFLESAMSKKVVQSEMRRGSDKTLRDLKHAEEQPLRKATADSAAVVVSLEDASTKTDALTTKLERIGARPVVSSEEASAKIDALTTKLEGIGAKPIVSSEDASAKIDALTTKLERIGAKPVVSSEDASTKIDALTTKLEKIGAKPVVSSKDASTKIDALTTKLAKIGAKPVVSSEDESTKIDALTTKLEKIGAKPDGEKKVHTAAEGQAGFERTVASTSPSKNTPAKQKIETAELKEADKVRPFRSQNKSFSEELRRLDAQFSSPSDSEEEMESGNTFVGFTPQKATSEVLEQPSASLLPLTDFSFQSLDTGIDHSILADICDSFENAANIATPPMLCAEYDEDAGDEAVGISERTEEPSQRMSSSVPTTSCAETHLPTKSHSLAASPRFSPVTPSSASTVDVEETSTGCNAKPIARPETPPSVEMILKAVNSSCKIDEDELKRIIDGFEMDYNPILANISVSDVNEAIRQCLGPDQDLDNMENMLQYDDLSDAVQSGLINPETYVTNLSPEEYCASFEPSSSCPSTENEFSSDSSEVNKSFGPSSCETTTTGDRTPTTSAPSHGVSPAPSPGTLQTRLQNSMRISMEHDHTYLTSGPSRRSEETCSTPKKNDLASQLPSNPSSPFRLAPSTSAQPSTTSHTRSAQLSEYEAALLKIDEIVEECEREVNRSMQGNQLSEYEAAIRKLEEVVKECEKEEKKEQMRKIKEAEQAKIRQHEEEARRKIAEERNKAAERCRLEEQRKTSIEAARHIVDFYIEDLLKSSLDDELEHQMQEWREQLLNNSVNKIIENCIEETMSSVLETEVKRSVVCRAVEKITEDYVGDAVSATLNTELNRHEKEQILTAEATSEICTNTAEDMLSSSLKSEAARCIEEILLKNVSSSVIEECSKEVLGSALDIECQRRQREETVKMECAAKVSSECIEDVLSSTLFSEIRRRELEEALTGKATARITQYCSSSALDSLLASAIERHDKQEQLKERALSMVTDSCASETISSALSMEVRHSQEQTLKHVAATKVTDFCATNIMSSALAGEIQRFRKVEGLTNRAAAAVTEACTSSIVTNVLSGEIQRHRKQEAMKEKAVTKVTDSCTNSIISSMLSEEVERHRRAESLKKSALCEVSKWCASELLSSTVRHEAALCVKTQQLLQNAIADVTTSCTEDIVSSAIGNEVDRTIRIYAEQITLRASEAIKTSCISDTVLASLTHELAILTEDLKRILKERSAKEVLNDSISHTIRSTLDKGIEEVLECCSRQTGIRATSEVAKFCAAELTRSTFSSAMEDLFVEAAKKIEAKASERVVEHCAHMLLSSITRKQVRKVERKTACRCVVRQLVETVVREEAEERERMQVADNVLRNLEDTIAYNETCERASTLMKVLAERSITDESVQLFGQVLSDMEDEEVQEVAEKVFEEEACVALSSCEPGCSKTMRLNVLKSPKDGSWKPLGLLATKRLFQMETSGNELEESLAECNLWNSEVDEYLKKFDDFYEADCALVNDIEAERKNYLFLEFMSNSTIVSDTERLLAESRSRIEALLAHREVCMNEVNQMIQKLQLELSATKELQKSAATEVSRLSRIGRSKQNQLQVQGNKERRARELTMTEFCNDVESAIRRFEKQLLLREKIEKAVRSIVSSRREQTVQPPRPVSSPEAEQALAKAVMRHSSERKITSEFLDSLNSFVKDIERKKDVRGVVGYLLDSLLHAEEQEIERTSAVIHTVSALVSTVAYNRLCEEANAVLAQVRGKELDASSEACSSEIVEGIITAQTEAIARQEMNKAVISLLVNTDYNSRVEVCVPELSSNEKEAWKLLGLFQSLNEDNVNRAERDAQEVREELVSWEAEINIFLQLFEKFSQTDSETLKKADVKRKAFDSLNKKFSGSSHLQEIEEFLAQFRKRIDSASRQEGSPVDTVLKQISAVENELETVRRYESALAEELKMLPTCGRLEQKQQKREIDEDRRVRRAFLGRCEENLSALVGQMEKCLLAVHKKERRMQEIVEPEAAERGSLGPSLRPRSGVTRLEVTAVDRSQKIQKVETFIMDLQAFVESVERRKAVRYLMDDLLTRTSYDTTCQEALTMLATLREKDTNRLASRLLECTVDEVVESQVDRIAETAVRTAVEPALAISESGSTENGQEERGSFLYLLESQKNFGWNNAEVICKEVTRELSTWVWEVDAYFARFEQLAEADRKMLRRAETDGKKRLAKIQNFENPTVVKKAETFLKAVKTKIERHLPCIDIRLEELNNQYAAIQEELQTAVQNKNTMEAELAAQEELMKLRHCELDKQMTEERQQRTAVLLNVCSEFLDVETVAKRGLEELQKKVSVLNALTDASEIISSLPAGPISSIEGDVALALSVVVDAVECKEMDDFIDELTIFIAKLQEKRLRRPRSALELAVQDVVDCVCLAIEASFWQIEPGLQNRMIRWGPPFHYEKFAQLLEAGLLSPAPSLDFMSIEEELTDVSSHLRTPLPISAYCTLIPTQLDFFDEPPENFLEFDDEPSETADQLVTANAERTPTILELSLGICNKKELIGRASSLPVMGGNERCSKWVRPSSAPPSVSFEDVVNIDRSSCSPSATILVEPPSIPRPIPIAVSAASAVPNAPLIASSSQLLIGQSSAFTPFQRQIALAASGVENSYAETILDPNLISLLLTQISPSVQQTPSVNVVEEPPPADPRPAKRVIVPSHSGSKACAAEQRQPSLDSLESLNEKRPRVVNPREHLIEKDAVYRKNLKAFEKSFPQKRKRVSFQEDEKEPEEEEIHYLKTVMKTNLNMRLYPGLRRIRKVTPGTDNMNYCSHSLGDSGTLSHDEQSEESSPGKNVSNMKTLPSIYNGLSDQSVRFAHELLYGGYKRFSDETVENMSRKGLIYQRLWRAVLVTNPFATWIKNNERVTLLQRSQILGYCRRGTKLFYAYSKFARYMTENVHIIKPVLCITDMSFCFDRLPTVFARIFDNIFNEIRIHMENRQMAQRHQSERALLSVEPQRNSLPSFSEAFRNRAPLHYGDGGIYERSVPENTFDSHSTLLSDDQHIEGLNNGSNTIGMALFAKASDLDRQPKPSMSVAKSLDMGTAVSTSTGAQQQITRTDKKAQLTARKTQRKPRSTSRPRKAKTTEDDIQPCTSTQNTVAEAGTKTPKKASKKPSLTKPIRKAKQLLTGLLNIESEVESDGEPPPASTKSSGGTAERKKRGRIAKTKKSPVETDEPSTSQVNRPKRQPSTARGRRRRHKSTSSEGSKASETKPTQKKRSRTVESRMRTSEPELTREELMVRAVEKAIADEYGRQAVPFAVLMAVMEEVIVASKKGDDLTLFTLNESISSAGGANGDSWISRLLHKDHKKKVKIDECAMIELLDMLMRRAVRIAISDKEKEFCRKNNLEELEFHVYKFNLWLENENVRRKNMKQKHVTLVDDPSMQAITAVLREVNFLTDV
ncbi:hypothetical protein Tcan_04566 [Toxocara canis]|uniref:Uncharacterized protein n=1 Tax=Toxocara canis TaxID=6265 RepID=A0A0B2V1M1_TOXCA|nr:hypothetical protein Tcan_04566 [Toxocara canis]